MYDSFNRNINYLRISVTDRCNLRCTYCMPEEGIKRLDHKEILSFEEIIDFVKFSASKGINKVRVTGGEPLVRKNIIELISEITKIKEITDLGITSNGILLDRFAHQLKEAGLKRVNISLDTMDPDKYQSMTRVGKLEDVLKGIKAAKKAGLSPIKINCVVKDNSQEPDARAVKAFAEENDLKVRFIRMMDLDHGTFSRVIGGDGGNCSTCNRLRLTANGKLKPCLFDDIEFDIRELGFEEAYDKAIALKPSCGSVNNVNEFYNIGG